MVTLIKGTIAGEANANSYSTVAEIKTYASDRGHDLTDTEDDTIASWAIIAMDYLYTYYSLRWKGVKTYPDVQALDWPRSDVEIEGVIYGPYMPIELSKAQSILVASQFKGITLFPTGHLISQPVEEETIGPITMRYFKPPATEVQLAPVNAMLAQLLEPIPFLRVARA